MKQKIWVEWSHSQQAFHYSYEQSSLSTNLLSFIKRKPMDYILLGIFNTRKEADAFTARCAEIRDRRAA